MNKQSGYLLVSAVVMILFLTAIGVAIAGLVAEQYQHTTREVYVQNAQLVAEAGIEQSVYELNTNDAFSGYSSPQQFFNNSTQGEGTFTTAVTTNADGTSKTIVSTGKVYHLNNTSTPYITRQIRVTVVGTSSQGYSVFSGPGGLILGGVATITNSAVYVGGSLAMSGLAQIGTSANPLTVDVGNNQCPSGGGTTYPQVCSNGTQPISMSGLAHIYGTVCATGQTNSSGISGLQAGCTAPATSQPTYNRQAQINAVTTTASGSSSSYICSGLNDNVTWPANLELTGNVNVSGVCNVTVDGDVYVTGNLTISGVSSMKVANSAGTNLPVIIVDGTISVSGVGSMAADSAGTGIEFISFKSTASCSPSCTSVTGTDLYNSQKLQTISVTGVGSLPGMIFDAYWGEATISGVSLVGAIAGQTVNMSGIGTVVFGTELSSGSKTWTITSYQPLYSP